MIHYEYADLFRQNSIDKQISIKSEDNVIEITNSDICGEEFELNESLCSESELTFGCCEAGSVKFKVANVFVPLKDRWLTVKTSFGIHADAPFMLGKYKVYSDVPTADRNWRTVTAYDALYDVIHADVADWYQAILPDKESRVTVRKFRDSFFKHFGIEQAEITLVNDAMVIEKTVEIKVNSQNTIGEVMSGKEVLACILEINACFGHMGRDGKFHYVYLEQNIDALYPRNDLFPADTLFPREQKTTQIGKGLYKNAEYEDYLVKRIDKLQIREKENDIGVIVGNGDNCYIIEGNFLAYGKGTDDLKIIANHIYEKIKEIVYRPFSAECLGNPCLEVGNAVRIPTKREIIESYILKRTLKGIQALTDTYEADGEEYRTQNVNGMQKSILQLKGRSNTLERTIEETKSQIVDVEQGLKSEISQTATEIRAEISDTEKGLKSEIKQNSDSITAEVKRAQGQEVELAAAIKLTSESITSEVSRARGAEEHLSSEIQQTADSIKLKVSAGEVISAINLEKDAATIDASKINLNGVVTANDKFKINLDGTMETTDGIFSGTIDAAHIKSGYLDGTKIFFAGVGGTVDPDTPFHSNQSGIVAEAQVNRNILNVYGADDLILSTSKSVDGGGTVISDRVFNAKRGIILSANDGGYGWIDFYSSSYGHTGKMYANDEYGFVMESINAQPMLIKSDKDIEIQTMNRIELSNVNTTYVDAKTIKVSKDNDFTHGDIQFYNYDTYTGVIWAAGDGFVIEARNGKDIAINADAGSGTIRYYGNLVQNSSKRYKKNITEISAEDADLILKLNTVGFLYKKSGKHCYGLIAEEVEPVLPQIVNYDNGGKPDGVSYIELIPLIIKEVQLLAERIKKYEQS